MMLSTFVLALACVGSSLGLSSSSFGKQPWKAPEQKQQRRGSSILHQVRKVKGEVVDLITKDEKINELLNRLLKKDELNTILNEAFNNEIFPEFQKAQDVQNAALKAAEDKAKEILELADDIGIIADNIDELEAQIVEADDRRVLIDEDLKALAYQATEKDTKLNNADVNLENQDYKLEKLEDRAHVVADTLAATREKLRKIIDILNSDNAQTLEITLTSGKNAVSKPVTADFGGRRPNIQYGITALHVSDRTESHVFSYPNHQYGWGFGANDLKLDPSIYFNVDVDLDEDSNKVTARLYDLSTGGWSVDKVVVQVALYKQDNKEIEHEDEDEEGPY